MKQGREGEPAKHYDSSIVGSIIVGAPAGTGANGRPEARARASLEYPSVQFKYRPVTKTGEGDWSQPVSLIVTVERRVVSHQPAVPAAGHTGCSGGHSAAMWRFPSSA
jgi:hypothetical protein